MNTMGEGLAKSIILSQTVTNFAQAALQGAFAYHNILSQLGFHDFNPDELSKVERYLSKIEVWISDLYEAVPILNADWKKPETSDAKALFECLGYLKVDLLTLAGRVKKIIFLGQVDKNPEDVKLLISAFARFAYSKENYIKGFLKFAEALNDENMINQYNSLLSEASEGINATHLFYSIFTQEEEHLPVFYRGLIEECSLLPGTLRAQAHDINVLFFSLEPEFSFSHTDIPPEQHSQWKEHSFDAKQAGYWYSWEIGVEASKKWLNIGVTDPKRAFFWKLLGFKPRDAKPWIEAGFPPPTARDFRERGLVVEEALEEIRKSEKEKR